MMHLTDLAQRSRSSHDTSYAPHGVSLRLTVDQHLLSYDAAACRSTYPLGSSNLRRAVCDTRNLDV